MTLKKGLICDSVNTVCGVMQITLQFTQYTVFMPNGLSNGNRQMFAANVLTGSTCMRTPNSSLRMPPLKTMEASSDIDFKDVCHNSVSGVIGDNIVYMTSTNLKAYFITYSADRLQILLYCCIHWVNRIFLSFSV